MGAECGGVHVMWMGELGFLAVPAGLLCGVIGGCVASIRRWRVRGCGGEPVWAGYLVFVGVTMIGFVTVFAMGITGIAAPAGKKAAWGMVVGLSGVAAVVGWIVGLALERGSGGRGCGRREWR